MPQENGTARPLWFLFKPSYWGIRFGRRKSGQVADSVPLLVSETASPEVAIEAERTLRNGDDPHVPVRLVQLRQVYVSAPVDWLGGVTVFCCRFRKWAFCSSAADVAAVDGLTFSIAEGQVFCLLGHNGAGKVTRSPVCERGTDAVLADNND